MRTLNKTTLFVVLFALIAVALGIVSWQFRQPSPGLWPLLSFILVALLLDQSSTELKVSAAGSTSFVVHIAAGILFGGFWGAVIVVVSTALAQLTIGKEPLKLLFNVSQRAAAVMIAVLVYHLLGGGLPPAYLQVAGSVDSSALQRDFFLFFAYAATYFTANSMAVSGVVAINSERSFRDVWNLNTRGVIGVRSRGKRDRAVLSLALHAV